jgi:integrase
MAANKTLKVVKTFLRWCVGHGILDKSAADGVPLPTKEMARDRILADEDLARVIIAARTMGGPYGRIVEFLALTGQRREEVARANRVEFDLGQSNWTIPKTRTKHGKVYIVHLSRQSLAVLRACEGRPLISFHPRKRLTNGPAISPKLLPLSGAMI